jgi:hypothetical protein
VKGLEKGRDTPIAIFFCKSNGFTRIVWGIGILI